MRKFLLYATLAILLITPAAWGSYGYIWYNINVSDLPASCEDGEVMAIIDGDSASDCTTGGSTTTVVCYCEDNAWSAIGGGAATGSGTKWYLTQWADNSGTLEDSTIYHDDDVGVDRYGVGDGIGATAPSGILHLSRASANPALYITTDGGSAAQIFFRNPSSLGGTSSGWIGQNDFNLRMFGAYGGITLSDPSNQTTSATNTMVIWPDGDISIGNAGVIVNPTNRTDGTNTLKHVNLYPGRMFQFGNWAADPTVGDTGTVYYSTSTGHLRAYMASPSPGWYDLHGGAHTTDTDTNANTECSGTTTYLDGEGTCDDLQSTAYAITADWDFGGGGIEVENAASVPGSCTVGQVFVHTAGTSGQQLYACEGGTFVLQGDGGGTPPEDSVGTVELDDDANTPVAGYAVIVETGALSFDYLDQSGWDQDSSDDFSPTDIDTDYAAETVASLWDFTSNLTLDSITADTTLDAATGNEVAYQFDYTTNKATSGNDTGIQVNQTDTLSPGTSLLLDLQVGGTSKAAFNNSGFLGIGHAAPSFELHIKEATDPEARLECTGVNCGTSMTFDNDAQDWQIGIGTDDTFFLYDVDNTVYFLQATPGGGVVTTRDWDFGGGGIEIENGTTPPACTVGQLYLDTDATSGQQLMACEGGTFVKQGDGGGGFTDIDTDYGVETVTSAWTITGDWDFGGGGIEIENGTTPPACTVGQLFLDTDATSGQQLMACEGGTFVLQGDGGGGGGGDIISEGNSNVEVIDTGTGRVEIDIDGTNIIDFDQTYGMTFNAAAADQIKFYSQAGPKVNWWGTTYLTGINSNELVWAAPNTADFSWRKGGSISGTEVMELDGGTGSLHLPLSTAEIGIGTASPADALHIYGSGNKILYIESTGASAYTQLRLKDSNRDWAVWQSATNDFVIRDVTGTASPVIIEDGAGSNAMYVHDTGNTSFGTSVEANDWYFYRSSGDAILEVECVSGGCNSAIFIDGIGAAWYLGQESGGSNFEIWNGSGYTMFEVESGGTLSVPALFLDSGGNLGGSTTTPSEELHIQRTTTGVKGRFETTATNGLAGVELKNDAVTWDIRVNGSIGDNLQVHDGTSPIASFEVGAPSGTIYADSTGAVALGGATVASTQGVLTLKPIATAPATCAIGDIYVDTSGAACFCTATNTWSNAVATGTCA